MTRVQAAAFVTVLALTGVAALWALPTVAAQGPQERVLDSAYVAQFAAGTVTLPAQWRLDLASTASGSPQASGDDVTVTITDAIWTGSTRDLLRQAEYLFFNGDAKVPSVPDDAAGQKREQWTLSGSIDGEVLELTLIRQDFSVVLVAVSAQGELSPRSREAVKQIIASVVITAPSLDVEALS